MICQKQTIKQTPEIPSNIVPSTKAMNLFGSYNPTPINKATAQNIDNAVANKETNTLVEIFQNSSSMFYSPLHSNHKEAYISYG